MRIWSTFLKYVTELERAVGQAMINTHLLAPGMTRNYGWLRYPPSFIKMM